MGPPRETHGSLDIIRVPLTHRRGNKSSYIYKYSTFISLSAAILAWRAIRRRYDLIYVNNMPDVLVASALVPKLLGAKVILDQHDPMPEVMKTIFGLDERSFGVRLLTWLEKWSIARADRVITVNAACKRIFGSRSCRPEKIAVVMNSPDEDIFPFRAVQPLTSANESHGATFRDDVSRLSGGAERTGPGCSGAGKNPRDHAGCGVKDLRPRDTLSAKRHEPGTKPGTKRLCSYRGPRTLEALVGEIEGCDVGVIPNQRSAFADINTPTRIFEYLALGKPVIAPRTQGIEDYFAPDSLLYFDCGNADDLARAMLSAGCHYRDSIETARRGQQVYLAHTWTQERNTLVSTVADLLT